jgi:hypothetical protein
MGTTTRARRRPSRTLDVLVGIAAALGIIVSSALTGVAVAGLLQWNRLPNLPRFADNALPVVVLLLGMLLAGRVAVDVAGRLGLVTALGAALVLLGFGLLLSKASEAHGDGVEPLQVSIAALVVLVVVGGSAAWVTNRRRSTTESRPGAS